jgi:hypothetical protein
MHGRTTSLWRCTAVIAVLALETACGGSVASTTPKGGDGNSRRDSGPAEDSGVPSDGSTVGDGTNYDDGAVSSEGGDQCESNGETTSHQPDGGCEGANAFGTCKGEILEVDCVCVNAQHGICICKNNGVQTQMVEFDCGTCEADESSWAACGFPSL